MKKSTKALLLGGAAGAAAAAYIYQSKKSGQSPNPLRRLFPVFTMPEPRGPYAIGTFEAHLTDPSRQESRRGTAPLGAGAREVPVTVWYPADPVDAEAAGGPEHYPASLGECMALVFGLPQRLFGHLEQVATHTFRDIPLSAEDSAYPVLLFSPGIRSTRFQSLMLIEELVSRGYIVVGMDHPYTSARVQLADGSEALYMHEPVFGQSHERYEYNVGEVAVRAKDARFVLDTLEAWNTAGSGHLLCGRMDLERAGILGHSYGGATAAEALGSDGRFAAALSLEGGFWSETPQKPLARPFMYLFTGGTQQSLDPKQPKKEKVFFEEWQEDAQRVMRSGQSDRLFAVIEPFFHQSFTDVAFVSPQLFARQLTPERTAEITSTYSAAFFDRYLKGIPSNLLGQDQPQFPEVRYDPALTRIQVQDEEAQR
ncbi:alpha/beta hydrolase family protein [Saccharibacillus qingshengii]|uniref:alpha/beta hydrolase family protein n=1 Tax=Saccharibacillus qingshengii TaxID=1763540 RepID=UPI001554A812|nr:lipase [Saccharibacillus qingshengii]